MKEKTTLTKPIYRYRTDSGSPTCAWDWGHDEVCEHYHDGNEYCQLLAGCAVYDAEEDGRVIPLASCPFWADDVEVQS